MPGSCSYVGGNPSKNLCCEFRGIFEREKLVANISEVGEHEIQISQQRVLVPWLLCRHCHIFYGRYLLVCQTSVALLLLKIGKILVGRLPVERGGKIACLFVLQKL